VERATADAGRPLRIALLSYRSKPHCGGQGVYVRNLSRELVALGHDVEVISGPPYPDLDPGVRLTELASLDLYREPDPFRTPHLREFRSPIDVLEYGLMATAAFPEPLTFSLRAWQAASTSPQVRPAEARTVRATGSTMTCFMPRRSRQTAPSATADPVTP
jgi:hypothetical protein